MKTITDEESLLKIGQIMGYDTQVQLLEMRGLQKDYNWDINDKPAAKDTVDDKGEGTILHNQLHSMDFRLSYINRMQALTLDPIDEGYGQVPYMDDNLASMEWRNYTKFSDLCEIRTDTANAHYRNRSLEYYPEDFLYTLGHSYSLNNMITLRRFPYPCIDNIMTPEVQIDQDMGRMVTYFDNEMNRLEDILGFSYQLNWKELEAGFERMQMMGDQEGLSGWMKKIALIGGDEELIKNRLRGPNGNQYAPNDDSNKVHGPVDSLTKTHIRDNGLDFTKEFKIDFTYKSRSYGGRNPDAIMKDVLANILLCTYNDGEFWPGARYWQGVKPSKATNLFQWTSSDNIDTILKGGFQALTTLLMDKFGSPESALETLKNIVSGGIKMLFANVLNKAGRAGVPFCNSLLSNSPVGQWHLTIGHPLNPIMTIGNLICTGVEVSFPDDTLSYGGFPTTLKASVSLKPAMSRDRAGIEMLFNNGRKRLYMPCVIPTTGKDEKHAINSPYRDCIDKGIDKVLDLTEVVFDDAKKTYNTRIKPYTIKQYKSLTGAAENVSKYVKNSADTSKAWITDKNQDINETPIVIDVKEYTSGLAKYTSKSIKNQAKSKIISTVVSGLGK